MSWERNGHPRRAGVSAFGVSGTNAHVILEEPPALEPRSAAASEVPGPLPWVVSGRGDAGLRGQAAQLASFVRARQATGTADRGWLAGVATGLAGRAGLEDRAVVVGSNADELLAALEALAAEGQPPRARTDAGVVFVFPGQGGQWLGMGRELLASWPVFAKHMSACEEALAPFVDWSLSEVLTGSDEAWLGRVDVVQPVLWAVMVSLAGVWRDAGVEPDAVVGHSQGEIAAAVVAGRLSLEDGARIVALRSRALRSLAGHGAMASIGLDPEAAEEHLTPGVSVAAINAPSQIVVSGPPDEVAALCARLDGAGVRARQIDVDYASHHAQVEAVEEQLRADLAGVVDLADASGTSGPVLVSTVTGQEAQPGELGAEYWYRNLREPVQFADAVRHLQDEGPQVFLEVGPHPVLSLALEQSVTDGRVLHTLRRDQPEQAQLLTALGAAWAGGLPVVWRELLPVVEPVALPTYAFQRQRYWLDAPVVAPAAVVKSDSWRYRVGWTPLGVQQAGGLARRWLLLCHDDGEVVRVRQALEQAGAKVDVRTLPTAPDREGVAELLAGAEHVAYLPAGVDGGQSVLSAGLASVVAVMQAVVDQASARLWVLTRGAVT
ncbi:acyltransferase domain-containing protein, partial [Streptomyces sp. NPDC047315]|uniref:acyltransferase domain-containing protein n=1 Tax=Streptomyces sp. NPDC047315 TaxID=3155142 RepID=UPI0033F3788C